MRAHVKITLLVTAIAVMAWAAPATAAPDYQGVAVAGQPYVWNGTVATGVNVAWVQGDGTCTKTPDTYCDQVLIRYDMPIPDDMIPAPTDQEQVVFFDSTGQIKIDTYAPFPLCDFDLYAYSSDASGARGDELDSSGEAAGTAEAVSAPVESIATVYPDGTVLKSESTYVLAIIVYFTVPQSNYKGTAKLL
jgi:hypothetical protein